MTLVRPKLRLVTTSFTVLCREAGQPRSRTLVNRPAKRRPRGRGPLGRRLGGPFTRGRAKGRLRLPTQNRSQPRYSRPHVSCEAAVYAPAPAREPSRRTNLPAAHKPWARFAACTPPPHFLPKTSQSRTNSLHYFVRRVRRTNFPRPKCRSTQAPCKSRILSRNKHPANKFSTTYFH